MSRFSPRHLVLGALLVVAAVLAALSAQPTDDPRRLGPRRRPPSRKNLEAPPPAIEPAFTGKDGGRKAIAVTLTAIADDIDEPTDLQFVPAQPGVALILEKGGRAKWLEVATGKVGVFFEMEVLTASEEGLLGLAFHPQFEKNGLFYLNAVVAINGVRNTRISEWSVPPGKDLRAPAGAHRRTILEVYQPYPNHNAGQLAFGPDGYLYIGFGDGGAAGDPHNNGQDPKSMLGKMLRVDVDRPQTSTTSTTSTTTTPGAGPKAYSIPADNPFARDPGYLPEIWALGLRNPWRYSFDPKGRLVVGDVGQDRFEELSIVEPGKNYGWKIREGRHCFDPMEGCRTAGLVDPLLEYGREDGGSITGGYVATSHHVPALKGKYVFGDFLSGRLWAIELPSNAGGETRMYALGEWPIMPSTFGRDLSGTLYVADFRGGVIYRIDPGAR